MRMSVVPNALEPRGPVSDGTLRCPVTHNGLPCQRLIPEGWHENEGHGGGHSFQSDTDAELMRTAHYDATAAISFLPFTPHAPADCPGPGRCSQAETPC